MSQEDNSASLTRDGMNLKNSAKRIKGILTALMYVAIYYAVSAVIESVYIMHHSFDYGLSVSEIERSVLDGAYALSVISAVISLWIYLIIGKINKKPIEKEVHNKKVVPMINIMAVCMAIGARMSVNSYYYFSQSIHLLKKSIDDAAAISPELSTVGQMLTAVFAIAIIAPFFEEVLFRGLVYGKLRTVMRPWAAIFLQAVFFGVAHAVLFQSIFAVIMGILLGIIYYKIGSIVTSAICHSAFNLSVVFFYEDMTALSAVLMLVFGSLLVISSMIYIIKSERM